MNQIFRQSQLFAFLLIFFFISPIIAEQGASKKIVIDSAMTFTEATAGTKAPKKVLDSLILLTVDYYSYDGKLHRGQLLINKAVEKDIRSVFNLICEIRFPVKKVIPIVKYNWDDDASMADNNTSAFNYRNIAGTDRLSNHSFGRAVDLNPFSNPVIHLDGSVNPKGAKYNKNFPGTLRESDQIVKKFEGLGWRWGGKFKQYKDNHHFDKEG
ncbi:MAG: M15 family metallopeptidase [Candidatus Kapabacteria bacterium]|nr:M15 family metallopeptidase [Candidatus Kapabacteria bacterium]